MRIGEKRGHQQFDSPLTAAASSDSLLKLKVEYLIKVGLGLHAMIKYKTIAYCCYLL